MYTKAASAAVPAVLFRVLTHCQLVTSEPFIKKKKTSLGEGQYVLWRQHHPPHMTMNCCVITCRQVTVTPRKLWCQTESGPESPLRVTHPKQSTVQCTVWWCRRRGRGYWLPWETSHNLSYRTYFDILFLLLFSWLNDKVTKGELYSKGSVLG